jgi:hypothetical protein
MPTGPDHVVYVFTFNGAVVCTLSGGQQPGWHSQPGNRRNTDPGTYQSAAATAPAPDPTNLQAAVNSRPRKVLAWKTPAEVLDEQLQSLHQAGVATTR